jgi:hypothetical protein
MFGTVLGSHLALTAVGLVLLVSRGLGPDVESTPLQRIGGTMLGALLFPLDAIHAQFFLGRPLPGSDWPWILGVGAAWAGLATLLLAAWRRAASPKGRPATPSGPES